MNHNSISIKDNGACAFQKLTNEIMQKNLEFGQEMLNNQSSNAKMKKIIDCMC